MPNMSPVLRGLVLCVLSSSLAACGSASGAAGAGGSGGRGGRGGRGGGGLVPVVVGHVTQKDVPVDIAAIGNVEAYSTITVRFQPRAGESVSRSTFHLPVPWLQDLGLGRLLNL